MDRFCDHARRELFPKMRRSTLVMTILGEPDPKLCLEIGAAILLDKPILVIVPQGRRLPLALRTIANKIVEVGDGGMDAECQRRITAAVMELDESARFRSSPESDNAEL